MRKKYLLWGCAIIAFFVIVILCTITFTTFMGMKGARHSTCSAILLLFTSTKAYPKVYSIRLEIEQKLSRMQKTQPKA